MDKMVFWGQIKVDKTKLEQIITWPNSYGLMPPKGGHIVIRVSVRPSFRPSVRSSQIIFADG